MLRRKKSRNDILSQVSRLTAGNNTNNPRSGKIREIGERYLSNIDNSPKGKRLLLAKRNAISASHNAYDVYGMGSKEHMKARESRQKAMIAFGDTKFGRRTYMGINAG